MTKDVLDFEDWFELLVDNLTEEGISFKDSDSVREDYDKGRNIFDVVREIVDEYS